MQIMSEASEQMKVILANSQLRAAVYGDSAMLVYIASRHPLLSEEQLRSSASSSKRSMISQRPDRHCTQNQMRHTSQLHSLMGGLQYQTAFQGGH